MGSHSGLRDSHINGSGVLFQYQYLYTSHSPCLVSHMLVSFRDLLLLDSLS